MTWINRSSMGVVLLALAALAVGCCENEKNQIQYLTDENLKLAEKATGLENDLTAARTRESQLLTQMDSRDLQLTALQVENRDLKLKAA